MSGSLSQSLSDRLTRHGQQHVLRWWDELDDPARRRLAAQLDAIDFDELHRLWKKASAPPETNGGGARPDDPRERARRARPPGNVVRQPDPSDLARISSSAWLRGVDLLSPSSPERVGVILVAGGEGTRLRFPHPKGMFPIGPVTGRTLFQYLAEHLGAIAKSCGASSLPLYVMTSDATHDKTVAYFEESRYFDLPPEDVKFFRQGTMPVVGLADGRLLMSGRGEIAVSPDGHGGLVAALVRAGLLDDMRTRGIEHLFYMQVDNPTVRVCDPQFLGLHVQHGSELSTKVVAKRGPEEKMGVLCDVDGTTQIIEYSDMPADVAAMTDDDGRLRHWAGNTAIHVVSRSLLERLAASPDLLPFHIARKQVPHLDRAGTMVEPKAGDPPNACKFERFIFDALPAARKTLVVETDRRGEFNPLKDFAGENSPEAVRAALCELGTEWLRGAGIELPPGTSVEISPRIATGEFEFKTRGPKTLEQHLKRTPRGWVFE